MTADPEVRGLSASEINPTDRPVAHRAKMLPQGKVRTDRPYQSSHLRSTAVPGLACNPAEAKPFLRTPPSLSGEGSFLDISFTVEFSAENSRIGPILLTSIFLPAGQPRK